MEKYNVRCFRAKTNTTTLISSNLNKIKGDVINIYSLGYSTFFGIVAISTNLN